jgi:hypothetical protein
VRRPHLRRGAAAALPFAARAVAPRPTLPDALAHALACALALALLLCATPVRAHKASDSYLTISVDAAGPAGRWDIALRDLDAALTLDADGNGEITWGEVRARHADIAAYATQALTLHADERRCAVSVGEQLVDVHTDGAYSVLPLAFDCPGLPAQLSIDYRLFAELDPQHRGLLNLRSPTASLAAVFGPDAPQQRFTLAAPDRLAQFVAYGREGVWHIWIGFDHILFLLSLLLPAVLVRRQGRWQAADSLRASVWDVVRIVTAFTLAHSVTLTLATLGWVALPSRLVEAAIAASVVLAALNNVFPVALRGRWMAAFGFGLIHGFGFATVLADLALPADALLLALLGFNLGVELGQLAIVAVFLPLAFVIRASRFYRVGVLAGGSATIAVLAAIWFVERAFEVTLIGF